MIRLQWLDAPAAKAAAVIGCTDSYKVKEFCNSVCSRKFSSTSRDFENTVLYFSNLSKERVFSRSFTSTVLENSRINIFNILYLELGAARLNMMSI